MAGVNIDSDENVIWSSSQSMENTTPGRGLTNVSRVTTHTIEAMQTNGSDEHMPTLLSDSDSGTYFHLFLLFIDAAEIYRHSL